MLIKNFIKKRVRSDFFSHFFSLTIFSQNSAKKNFFGGRIVGIYSSASPFILIFHEFTKTNVLIMPSPALINQVIFFLIHLMAKSSRLELAMESFCQRNKFKSYATFGFWAISKNINQRF